MTERHSGLTFQSVGNSENSMDEKWSCIGESSSSTSPVPPPFHTDRGSGMLKYDNSVQLEALNSAIKR